MTVLKIWLGHELQNLVHKNLILVYKLPVRHTSIVQLASFLKRVDQQEK